MDIGLYLSVLRHYPLTVLVGLVLTVLLAFFSHVSVSSDGLRYRASEVYLSEATLLVTEEGFPYGRIPTGEPIDLTRYQYLATLYADLAESDAVSGIVEQALGELGGVQAYDAEARLDQGGQPLPVVLISAYDATPKGAQMLAKQITRGLRQVLQESQAQAEIPEESRVILSTVGAASEAEIFEPRRLTRPIMVTLLGIMATIAFVFVRENLRRGRHTSASLGPASAVPLSGGGSSAARDEAPRVAKPRRQAKAPPDPTASSRLGS